MHVRTCHSVYLTIEAFDFYTTIIWHDSIRLVLHRSCPGTGVKTNIIISIIDNTTANFPVISVPLIFTALPLTAQRRRWSLLKLVADYNIPLYVLSLLWCLFCIPRICSTLIYKTGLLPYVRTLSKINRPNANFNWPNSILTGQGLLTPLNFAHGLCI